MGRKRTDKEFREVVDKYHHNKRSPFLDLKYKIDMIKSFPVDVMHTADLGITHFVLEKLIERHDIDLKSAERLITNLRPYIPSEFPRKLRSLKEIKRYKATEFRFFALYFGIIFLKTCCKNEAAVNHFLEFSVAYRLLMGKNGEVDSLNLNRARHLLKKFVSKFPSIYGREYVSFNVHALLHLPDYVEQFGPVDGFSCYKYENYYQMLRKWIRKPSNYFVQILRRWIQTEGEVKKKCDGARKSFVINSSKKDCCLLLKDKSVFIVTEIGDDCYFGQRYINACGIFNIPEISLSAVEMNIFKVCELSDAVEKISFEEVELKMVRIPIEAEKFVVMPFLHYR